MVIVVNSRGVWEDVLSKIRKLHPHIPVQGLPSYAPERSACQTYRVGSASWGGSSGRSDSHGFKTQPSHPFAVCNVVSARVFGVPDLACGVGSSVGSDHACSNNSVRDHRHAPSKHNSSTDKRLQRWLPVCLPTLTEQGAPLSTCQRKPLSKTTYGLNTKFTSS